MENFSLTIPADHPIIIAIAGEFGSSKTTLVRVILDLIRPSAGEIIWQENIPLEIKQTISANP